MAWTLTSKLLPAQEGIEWLQGTASLLHVVGALYKMVDGLPVVIAGQTEQPFGVYQNMDPQPYNGQSGYNINGVNASPLRPATENTTTTKGERCAFIPLTPGLVLDTDLTPLLSRVAAAANTNTAQAICAYGGSTGDFTGGIVYLPEQDWQGIITASGVAAGNVTIVFTPAAPRACTTGDVVSAICFGVGDSPKFASSSPELGLSNAFADIASGLVMVRKVQGQFGATKGSAFRISCQMKAPLQ